jgi:hypothetical protein
MHGFLADFFRPGDGFLERPGHSLGGFLRATRYLFRFLYSLIGGAESGLHGLPGIPVYLLRPRYRILGSFRCFFRGFLSLPAHLLSAAGGIHRRSGGFTSGFPSRAAKRFSPGYRFPEVKGITFNFLLHFRTHILTLLTQPALKPA